MFKKIKAMYNGPGYIDKRLIEIKNKVVKYFLESEKKFLERINNG